MSTTAERGYGAEHERLRAEWQKVVDAGAAECARCGDPLPPGSKWDLGHTDDRTGYNGPECIPCNRGNGGRNGAAVTNAKRAMTVREW
jgi:hypothetical protein